MCCFFSLPVPLWVLLPSWRMPVLGLRPPHPPRPRLHWVHPQRSYFQKRAHSGSAWAWIWAGSPIQPIQPPTSREGSFFWTPLCLSPSTGLCADILSVSLLQSWSLCCQEKEERPWSTSGRQGCDSGGALTLGNTPVQTAMNGNVVMNRVSVFWRFPAAWTGNARKMLLRRCVKSESCFPSNCWRSARAGTPPSLAIFHPPQMGKPQSVSRTIDSMADGTETVRGPGDVCSNEIIGKCPWAVTEHSCSLWYPEQVHTLRQVMFCKSVRILICICHDVINITWADDWEHVPAQVIFWCFCTSYHTCKTSGEGKCRKLRYFSI